MSSGGRRGDGKGKKRLGPGFYFRLEGQQAEQKKVFLERGRRPGRNRPVETRPVEGALGMVATGGDTGDGVRGSSVTEWRSPEWDRWMGWAG